MVLLATVGAVKVGFTAVLLDNVMPKGADQAYVSAPLPPEGLAFSRTDWPAFGSVALWPATGVMTAAVTATPGGVAMFRTSVPRMQLRESPVVPRSLFTACAQTLNAFVLACVSCEPRVQRKSQLRAALFVCVASPLRIRESPVPAVDAENVPVPLLLCALKPPRVPLGFDELTLTRKRYVKVPGV